MKTKLNLNTRIVIMATVLILALITISTTTAAAISCDCGDICVNETGWWNDGGAFNASGAPIQAAVNAASGGETICVKAGSYTENVDVGKRLTIRSENGSVNTIVNAASSSDHVFDVTADYANISGFTVKRARDRGKAGIYLYNRQHCNISENKAYGNYYGIYLYSSSNNTLTSNTASNNGGGIALSSSSNNTLAGNTMSGNTCNFGVYGSSLSEYTQNIDTSNTVDGKPIYYWVDQKDRQIPSNAGFVGVVNGTNITVRDLRLTNNSQGALFAYTKNSRIENVTVSSNGGGIDLHSSSSNNITCNWVHGNDWSGFYLTGGSTDNNISYNNIIIAGGYEYQFKNYQPDDVNATNNWWGTTDNDIINASIFDWQDDPNKGIVTYLPKLGSPSPCAPIPELPTVLLLAVGLLALVGYVRIRRKT